MLIVLSFNTNLLSLNSCDLKYKKRKKIGKVLLNYISNNACTWTFSAYYFFATMVLEVVSIVLSTIVSWVANKGKLNQPIPAWINSV